MKKELMYVQGSSTPTFVIIKGLEAPQTDDVSGDYIGAYNKETMLCVGCKSMKDEVNNIVTVFGDDMTTTKIENVAYSQEFGIFYYDSQTDKFYDISGDVKSALNGQSSSLKWYPLNLLNLENPIIGEEIELLYDEDLINSTIEVEIINNEKQELNTTLSTDPIWLRIKSKNVKNAMVITNYAKGTLELHRGWKNNKRVSYKYTPSNEDTHVKFDVIGQNIFDNSFIQTHIILKVNPVNKPTKPSYEEDVVIYQEEAFKVVIKDGKAGKFYFLIPLVEDTVEVRFLLEMTNGRKSYNTPRGEGRGMPLRMLNKISLFDSKIGTVRHRYRPSKVIWINE